MTANLATPQSGAMTKTDTPTSVFFPHLATLFGFLMFFSLTRISLSLAVILLYLPAHNSKLVVEKGGLCYSNCRLVRVSDLCRSALHHWFSLFPDFSTPPHSRWQPMICLWIVNHYFSLKLISKYCSIIVAGAVSIRQHLWKILNCGINSTSWSSSMLIISLFLLLLVAIYSILVLLQYILVHLPARQPSLVTTIMLLVYGYMWNTKVISYSIEWLDCPFYWGLW